MYLLDGRSFFDSGVHEFVIVLIDTYIVDGEAFCSNFISKTTKHSRMTIHNLYMFDRQGSLMYYGEWNRKRQSGMTIDEVFQVYITEKIFL